jgi:hypothetical protein
MSLEVAAILLLLLDLSSHPGRIPRHDRIRWNTPGDDCPSDHHGIPAYPHPWQQDGAAPYPHIVLDCDRFGYFPALDPGFRLQVMGGGIDLHGRPDHDMVADMHRITIQNGTQDIEKDMIADVDVLTVATVEGWLNDRILTDLSQQLLEDALSFGHGLARIVEPEQFPGPLAFSFQVRVKTVVAFSG